MWWSLSLLRSYDNINAITSSFVRAKPWRNPYLYNKRPGDYFSGSFPKQSWWSEWSRKFFDKQQWWIDSVSRNQIASDTCVSLAAQKWIFYCRTGPLFLPFFGGITNDLSTTRNRSIIWRHCLCIGNGSGNIARNTGTGWCTFMSFSWPPCRRKIL